MAESILADTEMNQQHQCIYCKKYKTADKFNREHVISRMLGTYENAPVLNKYEVCKECNDYFCNELENKVSLDSLEGFLRMQHDNKKHSTKRAIGKTRLVVKGVNGIFKDLHFLVSSTPDNSEGIQLEAEPVIGIVSDVEKQEYNYYSLGEVPQCTEEIQRIIKQSKTPFIFLGLDQNEVEAELLSKGFDLTSKTLSTDLKIENVTDESEVILNIKYNIDSLLARLAAKNIFNFICYSYGKEFVLNDELDNIRSYIRYGKVNSPIKLSTCNGGLAGVPSSVEYGHCIGTAWTVTDRLCLMGFVSWYNSITYSFILKEWSPTLDLVELYGSVCDNTNRNIITIPNPIIIDWPDSKYTLECFDKGFKIVSKK